MFLGTRTLVFGQKNVDLKLSIISPLNGAIIPFGDTAQVIISIKNLGPDTLTMNSDSLFYTTSIFPTVYSSASVNLAPFDSVTYMALYTINNAEEDATKSACAYLLPSSSYLDSNQTNDTSCVSFTLKAQENTGIDGTQFSLNEDFLIYPNPAKQKVNLSFNIPQKELVTISVYDFLGRKVLNQHYNMLSGNQTKVLDISECHPGQYLVELQIGNKYWSRKCTVY